MTGEPKASRSAGRAAAPSHHPDPRPRLTIEPSDEAFTGERFVPGYRDGSVELEHVHRYCMMLPLAEGRKVLDIACGEGYGVDLLAQAAASAVGIDLDDRIVQRASRRYARANVEFKQGSVTDIPSADGQFDLAVCFETIEHVAEQGRVLSELKRVLSSQGILAISTPDSAVYGTAAAEHNHFHVKELSFAEFEALLRGHFKNLAFCKQEVVFGSLILSPGGTAKTADELSVLRLDPASGLICGSPLGEDIGEYIIALASDGELPKLATSLYAGDYPRKPISALAGGIAERDAAVAGLRHDLAALEVRSGALAGGIGERDTAIVGLRHDLDAIGTRSAALAGSIVERDVMIADLRRDFAATESTRKELAAELRDRDAVIADLRNELQSTAGQAGLLREELDERMRTLRALQRQLSEATARFTARLRELRRSAEAVDRDTGVPTSGSGV